MKNISEEFEQCKKCKVPMIFVRTEQGVIQTINIQGMTITNVAEVHRCPKCYQYWRIKS